MMKCLPKSIQAALNYPLITLSDTTITLLSILYGVFVFFTVYLIARMIERGISLSLQKQKRVNQSTSYTLLRLFRYCAVTLALILGTSALGLSLDNFAIIIGALGVGIGFGLQNIASNFISGLTILFQRNIKVGDFIELTNGLKGNVQAIFIQHTLIRTRDGAHTLIPNSQVNSGQIINWTLGDSLRRLHIPFKVAFGNDPEMVIQLVKDCGNDVECTVMNNKATCEPTVWLVEFGDSYLKFEYIVWIDLKKTPKGISMQTPYLICIERALRNAKLDLPIPKFDVNIKNQP